MLCDRCKRRDANVHVTQIVNGVKYEQNLCSECAQSQTDVLTSRSHGMSHTEKIMSILRNLGIVGVVVAPDMTPQTVHGRDVDLDELGLHLPGSVDEQVGSENVLSLKAELESAVTNENFERAAELRDKIYQLEHQTQEGQA